MNIAYLGPFRDHTGYGEANRHAIAALDAAGVNVQAIPVTYVRDNADFGRIGIRLTELEENKLDYKIKILHVTPDQLKFHKGEGKYNIAHFFWETSRVPRDFVEGLLLMDEIWTGSEHNKKALEDSGVHRPIKVFPQAIETERADSRPYKIIDFNGYLFYSIFEWIDRKNPEALINAYWQEFQKGENVGLLIKTYFKNFTEQNKDLIRSAIKQMKIRSGLENFPPIFLYEELLDRHQIMRIHDTGDCFVSTHRGEGWGIPQVEAMLRAKPMISTGCGGVHEYLSRDFSFPIPYKLTPVSGMAHSSTWYTSDQNWAEIDPKELRKAMRFCFENKKIAQEMGLKAHDFVVERFNLKRVGEEMKERLELIERKLG